MNTTMRQRGRNLVVFWVIVGLLSACSTQSTLNRESARKLIEQAMLKNPPTVAISLTPEVFFSFGKEESGFLAERGFDVTVLDEGKARVEFPQWARDLAVGRVYAWRLFRYGERPEVEVTGITKESGTIAMAEFRYKWSVNQRAEKLLREIESVNSEAAARFSPVFEVRRPKAMEGTWRAELRLFDDGWRAFIKDIKEAPWRAENNLRWWEL